MWGACGAHVGRMCGRALVRLVWLIVRPLDDDLNRFYNRKKEGKNMMKIVILQPDEKGDYIKKGECSNLKSLYEMVQDFANNVYCRDFMINMDFNDGTEPRSFSLTSYCNWQGIPIKWDKKE
jgi:hypothetical protein